VASDVLLTTGLVEYVYNLFRECPLYPPKPSYKLSRFDVIAAREAEMCRIILSDIVVLFRFKLRFFVASDVLLTTGLVEYVYYLFREQRHHPPHPYYYCRALMLSRRVKRKLDG
jgi:hypothetical protein